MSDQIFMMVLRVLHIGAGLFWVGSFFFMQRFILPALQEAGPDGGKFMAVLMRGGRVQRAMIGAAAMTILAGLLLYGRYIVQTDGAWARAPIAMGYGVGAIAAVIAFILGMVINAPAARRMQTIMAGGQPSTEQQAEVGRLRERMASTSRIVAVLLGVAVVSMAISRYL